MKETTIQTCAIGHTEKSKFPFDAARTGLLLSRQPYWHETAYFLQRHYQWLIRSFHFLNFYICFLPNDMLNDPPSYTVPKIHKLSSLPFRPNRVVIVYVDSLERLLHTHYVSRCSYFLYSSYTTRYIVNTSSQNHRSERGHFGNGYKMLTEASVLRDYRQGTVERKFDNTTPTKPLLPPPQTDWNTVGLTWRFYATSGFPSLIRT